MPPTRRKLANSTSYTYLHFQTHCEQRFFWWFKIHETTIRETPDSKDCTLLYFQYPCKQRCCWYIRALRVNPKEDTVPRNLTQRNISNSCKQKEPQRYWVNGINDGRNHDSENHTCWYVQILPQAAVFFDTPRCLEPADRSSPRRKNPSLLDILPFSSHIIEVLRITWLMVSPHTPGYFTAPCA